MRLLAPAGNRDPLHAVRAFREGDGSAGELQGHVGGLKAAEDQRHGPGRRCDRVLSPGPGAPDGVAPTAVSGEGVVPVGATSEDVTVRVAGQRVRLGASVLHPARPDGRRQRHLRSNGPHPPVHVADGDSRATVQRLHGDSARGNDPDGVRDLREPGDEPIEARYLRLRG